MLTRQSNADRIVFKAVLLSIDIDSQIHVMFLLPDVLDHEAAVSLLFLSNELCFPSVHLQYICIIGMKNIRGDGILPKDFDIASVQIQRSHKWTLYGHIWAKCRVDVSRHIDSPVFSCVNKVKVNWFVHQVLIDMMK